MFKSRTLIALCKTVFLPGKGKIMRNKLLVLLAVGAISVAAFLACDNNRTPGNGNNGGQEVPDVPRDQNEEFSLFEGVGFATIIGHMTNAQREATEKRIHDTIKDLATDPNAWAGDYDVVVDFFSTGMTFKIVFEPEEFMRWKTTGDGQTLYLNPDLLDSEFRNSVQNGVNAVFSREARVDGIQAEARGCQARGCQS